MTRDDLLRLLLDSYPPLPRGRELAVQLGSGATTVDTRLRRAGLPLLKAVLNHATLIRLAERVRERPSCTVGDLAACIASSSPQSTHRFISKTCQMFGGVPHFKRNALAGGWSRESLARLSVTEQWFAVATGAVSPAAARLAA